MTSSEARDEFFTLLKTEWDLLASTVVGGSYTPSILWQGIDETTDPPQGQAYARASVIHSKGEQASLGGSRWNRKGIIVVQCFGPTGGGNGLTIAEGLAKIAKDAYEGKTSSSGSWFRNCRINEIGVSQGWFQVNTIAEFDYDEVKQDG